MTPLADYMQWQSLPSYAEVYDVGRLLGINFDITAICYSSSTELLALQEQVYTFLLPEGVSPTHCCKVPHLYQEEALFLTNNDFD